MRATLNKPNNASLIAKILFSLLIISISLGWQNLPSQSEEETEEKIVAGYALYTDWIEVLDVPAPIKLHPLWVEGNIEEGNSWLCESCHGDNFDGNGKNGVTLWDVAKLPTFEIENWLLGRNNPDHDFSHYLNIKSINELTALMKYGIADIVILFDQDSEKILGEPASGEPHYKTLCSVCHGLDGAKINFGSAKNPYFLGDMVIEKPWEVAKIVRFGHKNIDVLSSFQTGLSLQNVADIVSYTEQFPVSQVIQANLPIEIDYSEQGDTIDVIYGALVIFLVIFLGVLWGERVRFQ
jgi:cytochrome c2